MARNSNQLSLILIAGLLALLIVSRPASTATAIPTATPLPGKIQSVFVELKTSESEIDLVPKLAVGFIITDVVVSRNEGASRLILSQGSKTLLLFESTNGTLHLNSGIRVAPGAPVKVAAFPSSGVTICGYIE